MLLQNNATSSAQDLDALAPPDEADRAARVLAVRALDASNQKLFEECHGRRGLQLRIEVAGETRELALDLPFVVIGSASACDVRIEHTSVLPFHAYVQWIDGRLYCSSLAESDSRSSPNVWLGKKPVNLGPFQLTVPNLPEATTSSSDPLARNPELAGEIAQVQLNFAGVQQRDNDWPIDRTLTLIGRGSQCKLRLDHPEIPLVLASLVRTASSCWLINLGQHELLRVNGQPLLLQSLDIGDKLELGAFQADVSTASIRQKKVTRKIETATSNASGPRSAAQKTAASTIPARTSAASAVAASKTVTVRELATRHRKRVGVLNKSLDDVRLYLDSQHLDNIPELKTALQQYVQHAQRYHREMQEALEQLASGS
jgi:hypothetical protein